MVSKKKKLQYTGTLNYSDHLGQLGEWWYRKAGKDGHVYLK